MAFRYNLEPNSPDSHQSNPWWFAVVVRFKHIRTFDRSFIVAEASTKALDCSRSDANLSPVDEREPLVLTNQITSFVVNSAKSSHTTTAAFRVVPGPVAFENQTHAGDWILFWAFDNYEDYQRVLTQAINTLQRSSAEGANGFMDGLKFIGRLNAPKLSYGKEPGSGVVSKEYELTAVGFGEMDSKVYFTEAHQAKYQELQGGYVAQIADLQGNNVSKVDEAVKGGVLPLTTKEHVSLWLETFLGAGPGNASKGFDKSLVEGEAFAPEVTNSLLQTPNDIFLVPSSVGRLLGIQSESNTLRYYDLLNVFIGVQGPSGAGAGSRNLIENVGFEAWQGFVPESIGEPSGAFRAQYMNFGGTSVWDLVSGFSNQPINEMFMSLRVNGRGRVGPSFILRQSPLSSPLAAKHFENRGWAMTSFTDLPRWVLSPALLVGKARLGPSDSLRYNYVSCQGQDLPGEMGPGMEKTLQTVLAPPMADLADIKRSGLRMFVATLNCDISGMVEQRGQLGRGYTQFMSDILMDGHLKWNGTIPSTYIQEPVAVGDNVEFDGVVYHIEAVSHSGSVSGDGRRTSSTTFQVSSGISVVSETYGDNVMPYENPAHDHSDFENRHDTAEALLDAGGALAVDQTLAEQDARQQQEMERALRQLSHSQSPRRPGFES